MQKVHYKEKSINLKSTTFELDLNDFTLKIRGLPLMVAFKEHYKQDWN
jgi:hypothetical protein